MAKAKTTKKQKTKKQEDIFILTKDIQVPDPNKDVEQPISFKQGEKFILDTEKSEYRCEKTDFSLPFELCMELEPNTENKLFVPDGELDSYLKDQKKKKAPIIERANLMNDVKGKMTASITERKGGEITISLNEEVVSHLFDPDTKKLWSGGNEVRISIDSIQTQAQFGSSKPDPNAQEMFPEEAAKLDKIHKLYLKHLDVEGNTKTAIERTLASEDFCEADVHKMLREFKIADPQ